MLWQYISFVSNYCMFSHQLSLEGLLWIACHHVSSWSVLL